MNVLIVRTALSFMVDEPKEAALRFFQEVQANPEQLVVEVFDPGKLVTRKFKMDSLNTVKEVT
jgi:hypothetical protein